MTETGQDKGKTLSKRFECSHEHSGFNISEM